MAGATDDEGPASPFRHDPHPRVLIRLPCLPSSARLRIGEPQRFPCARRHRIWPAEPTDEFGPLRARCPARPAVDDDRVDLPSQRYSAEPRDQRLAAVAAVDTDLEAPARSAGVTTLVVYRWAIFDAVV